MACHAPVPIAASLHGAGAFVEVEGGTVPQFSAESPPRVKTGAPFSDDWSVHVEVGNSRSALRVTEVGVWWNTTPTTALPSGPGLLFVTHRDTGSVGLPIYWGAVPGRGEIEAAIARARSADDPVKGWLGVISAARVAGVPSTESRALRAAAYHASWRHRFAEALALLDRADAIDARLGNVQGLVRAAKYRAQIEQATGRFREAAARLHSAANAAKNDGDTELWRGTRRDLSVLYVALGHADRAVVLQLDDFDLAGASLRDRHEMSANLGWALMNANQPEDARPFLADALQTAKALGDASMELNAYGNLAGAAWLERDRPAAARWLGQARQSTTAPQLYLTRLQASLDLENGKLGAAEAGFRRALDAAPPDDRWRAHHGLGRVAAARGDTAAATRAFKRAAEEVVRVARAVDVTFARDTFLADRQQAVHDLAQSLADRGDLASAFAIDDRARGAVLRALDFQGAIERLESPEQAVVAAALTEWRVARDGFEAESAEAWRIPAVDLPAWRAQRDAARAAIDRRFDAVESRIDPDASTIDATDIQRKLSPTQAIWFSGERSYWVTHDAVVLADPDALEAHVAGLDHLFIVGPDDDAEQTLVGDWPLAVVVPTSRLPFAGLLARPVATAQGPPLVVADPMNDLPRARAEGEAIAHTQGARALVGDDADRSTVLGAVSDARLFHFAGHGVLRPDDPWAAFLQLSGDTGLSLADVLALRPKLGVVVLNGCETGGTGGDGVGLPDAFLLTGARAVLATRRPVRDDEAARFVARFYANDGARAPATAMRAAVAEAHAVGQDWTAFYLAGRP